MRNFTSSERKVVNELIKWSSNGQSIRLGEILRELFPITYIKPSPKKDEEFYKHTIEIYYDEKKVSIEEILEAIGLFELLVQRNYIVVKQLFTIEIIGKEQNLMFVVSNDSHYVETTLVNYYNNNLWEFLCSYYYVTNGLKDFAKDFKSIEQRRSDKQNRITLLGIIVSFVIGIGSPLLTKCISQDDEQEKQEYIESAIKETKTVIIDSIKTSPTDTLNVNLIQSNRNFH